MWGGVTTPTSCARIADVVDKYKIPTVKVTGGQRIDLLGVKKEDLPAVWTRPRHAARGHAYAKALRTVKTCVGSEWCRFGTQDSTQMGIKTRARAVGACTRRTRSSSRCRAARATAPSPASRTSA